VTYEPIVSEYPTSCDECDCDIPTGCVVIKRSEPVELERQRILSRGPATVTIDGVKYGADVTVAKTYKEHTVAESIVCLDCAEPEERDSIEAVVIVEAVDATPVDILKIVPTYASTSTSGSGVTEAWYEVNLGDFKALLGAAYDNFRSPKLLPPRAA
jgi:hypothetical protein